MSLAGAALVVVACQEAATVPEFDDYRGAVTAASENAAFRYDEGDLCQVLDPDGNVWSGQVTSTTTNGNAGRVNATCALGTLPNETGRAITHKDVNCIWFADPVTLVGSVEAHMVVRPDGDATAQCHFRQSPPTAFVEGDGVAAAAIQGALVTWSTSAGSCVQ